MAGACHRRLFLSHLVTVLRNFDATRSRGSRRADTLLPSLYRAAPRSPCKRAPGSPGLRHLPAPPWRYWSDVSQVPVLSTGTRLPVDRSGALDAWRPGSCPIRESVRARIARTDRRHTRTRITEETRRIHGSTAAAGPTGPGASERDGACRP